MENIRKNQSRAAVRTLGRRSFKAEHTQNLLISVAVVIVTVLITAACSVFYNIQRFGQMQDLKETGVMTDVVLSNPDEQQLAVLLESTLVQQPLFVSYKAGRLVGNFEMTKVVPIYEHYSEEVYGDWLEIKNEFEQLNGMEHTDTGICRHGGSRCIQKTDAEAHHMGGNLVFPSDTGTVCYVGIRLFR